MADNEQGKTSMDKYQVDDGRAVIMAWLEDSSSNPTDYLTSEGMAYLNGFLQREKTMGLVKEERYTELLEMYEDLVQRYETLKMKKSVNPFKKFVGWVRSFR